MSRIASTGQSPQGSCAQLNAVWKCGQRESTDCGQKGRPGRPVRSCPPLAHRMAHVVHSERPLLHTSVHCSATKPVLSLGRVKGVTPTWWVALGRTGVFLGTELGRTPGCLCIGCAQLPGVHSGPWLSTPAAHRRGGQKTAPDQRRNRLSTVSTPPTTTTTRREGGMSLEVGAVHNSARPCPAARVTA